MFQARANPDPRARRGQAPRKVRIKRGSGAANLVSKKEMATAEVASGTATPKTAVSAVEMGARQREISVSEFFTKNRHLLGFDSPRKALLTCVKEAVDNALDACEEAGILPDVVVKVEVVPSNGSPPPPASQATRFRVTVDRQRPGHRPAADPPDLREAPLRLQVPPPAHEPRPAGHRHLGGRHVRPAHDRQAGPDHRRGPAREAPAHYFEVQIDTKKNEPRIFENKKIEWEQPTRHPGRDRARRPLPEGPHLGGRVPASRRRSPIPHVKLVYQTPEGETREYPRTIHELPPPPKEIKPHPYGIELGVLLRMLQDTKSHSLGRLPVERLQPRVRRPRPGDLRDGQALAERASRGTSTARTPRRSTRRSRRRRSWRRPSNCLSPDRREGDPPRPLQADQGRVLHRGEPPAGGLPRQSLRDRGRARVRARGPTSRRDRERAGGAARRGRGPGETTASSPA